MKTTKRILFFILLLTALTSELRAQKVNSLYFLERTAMHTRMNPAMAPKNSCIGLGLGNIAFNIQSDLALSDVIIPGQNGGLISVMHPDADKALFLSGLGDVSNFSGNFNMEILNLGIRMKQAYISFHSGIYMDMGLGMPKDFLRLFMLGMDATQASTLFDLSSLNFETNLYNKTGVGLSLGLGEIFSLGVNVDYLVGLANMKLGFDELSINATDQQWDVVSKGYIRYAGPQQLMFTYSDDNYLNGISTDFSSLTSANYTDLLSTGKGFSVDLGLTARPLPFLSLSASITDLGYINWNKDYVQQAVSNESFSFEGMELAFGESSQDEEEGNAIGDQLQNLMHLSKDVSSEAFVSKLTSKLNIGAEAGVLDNRISFGVLSQTAFADNKLLYQDLMLSANFKPGSLLQAALTYSLLHGKMSSFGAAVNLKLLFINFFLAADYIPMVYSPQMIPVNNSHFNLQTGFNLMF
ncbi:MAG: DUF5723 family protein [Bacteroidales bacterium]|nr:DUF5723 family protein [Bacteroidales bacterium]